MSKKPTISTEAQVLLKLLRLALGTEPRRYFGEPVEPFPANINWKEVIRLSYEQKVSALAVDGLKSSGYDIYNGLNEQQTKELKPIADHWFKDITKTEQSYTYYLQILTTLCQIFIANGLTPIILKGYGLSLNYPIPSHRGCGDIDIFLIDKEGKPAAEEAVRLIENTLNIKTKRVPHDYEFYFKGIEVELHYDTTNAYWNTNEEHYIVEKLTELLLQDPIPCPRIEGALLPSATFNAVYLIRHTFGHFYTASGNMRQYIDWLLFIQKHYQVVKWNIVEELLEKSEMKDFFNAILSFINYLFGECVKYCPIHRADYKLTEKVATNILSPVNQGTTTLQHIVYYFRIRWRICFLLRKHWPTSLIIAITSLNRLNKKKINI